MDDVKRIYSLLLYNNGLKIRDIANILELDKYYVAELLFSPQNISYWYQDDDSLWYAKEGALQIEEPEEEIDELIATVEIPQKFNINRFLEEDLSDSMHSYLNQISKYRIYSNDEIIELFKRYRNGDAKAFDMIIKSHQRLVANIALLYCRKGAPLEDIIQEGNIGLVKAAERFDYNQYRSFTNYAKYWILQSISVSMASMPYMVRLPLNQLSLYRKVRKFKEKFEQIHGYSPSVNDIEIGDDIDDKRLKYLDGLPYDLSSLTSLSNDLDIKESETNTIDDFVNNDESKLSVMNLLRNLRKRERQIIQRFYGINTKEEELSTIGDYYGLTRERVRQIKEKTVRHLRDILRIPHVVSKKSEEIRKKNNVDDEPVKEKKAHKIKINKTPQKRRQSKEFDDIIESESKHKLQDESQVVKTEIKQKNPLKVKIRDKILYDSKECTVIGIKEERATRRLKVLYKNGTVDDVKYDEGRFTIIERYTGPKVENNIKPDFEQDNKKEDDNYRIDNSPIDLDKLKHVFDQKVTTYKYFWFLSIISIAKERYSLIITFKDIVIRMAALAWPLVMKEDISFGPRDMMRRYLKEIQELINVRDNLTTRELDNLFFRYYIQKNLESTLSPLLKNVPFRFLSPWIKYESDEDVMNKSQARQFKGLYSLYSDRIILNKYWWDYIKENFDLLYDFAVNSLKDYLKQYNNESKITKLSI